MSIIKLKDICEIKVGKDCRIYKNQMNFTNTGLVGYLQISDLKDINSYSINEIKLKINKKWAESIYENVVICSRAGSGAIFKNLNCKAHLDNRWNILIPNEQIVIKKYLTLILNFNRQKIIGKRGYSVQVNISKEQLENFELNIPSIERQQQIIDIIEPFENLLNLFNKELELYNNFLMLLFYKMKTNNFATFFKFCTLKNCKYNNQTKYVDTSNISKSIFKGFEPVIKLKSRANLSPEKESIIFSKLKGENKIFPIYNEHYLEYVYSTGFINIKSKYNSYIYGYMLTDDFHKFKNNSCTGTVMESINNQTLEQWNIPELNYELWSDEYNKLLHLINCVNLKIKKVLNILNLLISIYII